MVNIDSIEVDITFSIIKNMGWPDSTNYPISITSDRYKLTDQQGKKFSVAGLSKEDFEDLRTDILNELEKILINVEKSERENVLAEPERVGLKWER